MQIIRGRVLAQRVFDIADEIDLRLAQNLVSRLSRRALFVGGAKHIQLPSPPLEMALGPRPCGVPNQPPADVVVHIYDVGALVVTFLIDLPSPMEPEALIAFAAHLSEAQDAVTAAAQPISAEVAAAVARACKPGEVSTATEDYTIFYLRSTDPHSGAETLGQALDIPRLLIAETKPIAVSERVGFVHASFSYSPDDLVVIDWNSALIFDPTGSLDVPELLEWATMQLLELRAYDEIVGKSLDRLYKELGAEPNAIFLSSHYQRLSRTIMQTFVDVSKITERIDNSLTFLGDTWLARIHRGAIAEFGIPHWQRQLRGKLEVLRQINELLVDQINSQKSLRIEGAVVVLILIELLVAMARWA